MRFVPAKKFLSLFLLSIFLSSLFAPSVQAYTDNSANEQTTTPYAANAASDVPQNQYTMVQSVTINVLATFICQLSGIDVIDSKNGCLGVDPVTKKISYAPTNQDGTPQRGGIIGMLPGLIGSTYAPPASGVTYVAQVMDNFGIVKPALAQLPAAEQRSGFDALQPVKQLWETVKNLTYLVMVIIFIFIGVGIMLRLKIDPRTSMTIQNQIPKMVIAIVLITFSYAIVGFMIDMMWLGTYVGVNAITAGTTEPVCNADSNTTATPETTLQGRTYTNLLSYPLAFFNDIFAGEATKGGCQGGTLFLTSSVGNAVGLIADNMVNVFIDPSLSKDCFTIQTGLNPGGCVGQFFGGIIGWIGRFFGLLIAFIAIIIVMLRVWWVLLKAYAYVIIYTVLGPLWILLGLLPNSSLGFSGWIRTMAAKLTVFPVTAIVIVSSKVILDLYNTNPGVTRVGEEGAQQLSRDPSLNFVPPLIGNPNLSEFGPLIAFAILLITPELLNMMNDAFKAPSNKYTGPAIAKGIGYGTGIVGGIAAGQLARTMKFDHKTNEVGAGRGALISAQNWARGKVGLSSVAQAADARRQKSVQYGLPPLHTGTQTATSQNQKNLPNNIWEKAGRRFTKNKRTP